jgi:hypothetical protein
MICYYGIEVESVKGWSPVDFVFLKTYHKKVGFFYADLFLFQKKMHKLALSN